ncbi:MAG TPA: prolyl oligopeptidase family serine peptidase [Acidimicrobiia bacterium]|jgi:hypothetical protein
MATIAEGNHTSIASAPPLKRTEFFADPSLEFLTRAMLGRINAGAADAGEVLTTIERIPDGDLPAWVREWEATANRVGAIGDDCLARGHRISARDALLRAASYYAACVQVVDGCDDPDAVLARTFHAHRLRYGQYLDLLDVVPERLEIPYEHTTLPGLFFPAAPARGGRGNDRHRTLVINNGADGSWNTLFPGHGSQAVARGYNVAIFDGPGQQSMLFDRGIPFRPDWEHVVSPLVDLLLQRPDVDPDRLVLYGVSQGGYWVPRTLAFEHRFAVAAADGGVVDVGETWRAHLPVEATDLLDAGEREEFNALLDLAPPAQRRVLTWRAKPYGKPTLYDTFVEAQRYRVTPELAAQITTPMLIADPDEEQFFPGQPQRLYDMLLGAKRIVHFAASEGASGHCQPMARALAAQRFFDFFDDELGPA